MKEATDFGTKLINLRRKRNISQLKLAKAIGIARTSISNYENGYQSPPLEVAVKIACYFNVSVNYLAGTDDYTISAKNLSKDEIEAVELIVRRLSKNKQDK